MAVLLFAAGFAVFAGLSLSLLVLADRERRRHQARLRRARSDAPQNLIKSPRKMSGNRDKHSFFAQIERHLAQTSLRLTLVELLVQFSVSVLGLYATTVLVLGMQPLLALPVAIAVPTLATTLLLRIAKTRHRAAFTAHLPEALDVFARGLRAGRPISDSLAIVVNTAKGPAHQELSRCHDEICLGTTLADSLARLEARIPTPEVSFFSVATSLQAETGGNMIETMEGLATQLRERRKLRKKARALSSEARASALILASLPFAVALVIALLNASYLEPLYADARGRVMAAAAFASIGLGVFIMAQMGKLDV